MLDKADSWTNYLKGVIKFLQEAGYTIDTGFEMYVFGNIPNGTSLSSSASLELLTGIVAEELFNLKLERLDLVKIGKQTENEFIGVNSGIMDQFAIGMGLINVLSTVTPIARKRDGVFELDIVLRDNHTTAEFPDGVYHPHADVQHIKKKISV